MKYCRTENYAIRALPTRAPRILRLGLSISSLLSSSLPTTFSHPALFASPPPYPSSISSLEFLSSSVQEYYRPFLLSIIMGRTVDQEVHAAFVEFRAKEDDKVRDLRIS